MTNFVEHSALNTALDMTMQRYPYFKVRYEEHEGDFYAVENDLPIEAYESEELIPLGGEENNYYLIGVTHHAKSIFVSFHHGLADGRGVKSFVETLIYYYCQAAYGSAAESEGILTADDTIADTEICEPCGSKYNIDRNDLKKIKEAYQKKMGKSGSNPDGLRCSADGRLRRQQGKEGRRPCRREKSEREPDGLYFHVS